VETYYRILKENLKDFTETKKGKKAEFVRNFVHTLRDAGFRFLRVNNNNECTEIGDKKAMRTVMDAFRTYTEYYAEIPETIIGACNEVEIAECDILVRKEAKNGNTRTSNVDYSRHVESYSRTRHVESYSRILKADPKDYTETKKKRRLSLLGVSYAPFEMPVLAS
jgi:hypothetical protein